MTKRVDSEPPSAPAAGGRIGKVLKIVLPTVVLLVLSGALFADWWICLPEDEARPVFAGRQSCVSCHQNQHDAWQGSHHDLAMDLATAETVLADFNDAELTHHDITSRMFRRRDQFMINTEGPDGQMQDFAIKYVFGVAPLQQYMVEFDRPDDLPENEIGRVQVLRISWDTKNKKWFYLAPPDVAEKLEPDDDLHWTGIAQRWNNMCADCHSTHLEKNFDQNTRTYHTTFSEIDVSCEACHGPGKTHVKLAKATSVFWDRKLGYGLAKLKTENSHDEIQACAPCHSRRRVVHPEHYAGDNYYDDFANELLRSETYHADGQILDEVYVYGSFIQSKMYSKGIRCTDCHDPHTTRVKHKGNKLCTSCHQHSAGKYDSPAHHNHLPGGAGASCVDCHMPHTTYMQVDARRDHSLRVPRPDLSIDLGVPNACTQCHLKMEQDLLPAEQRSKLPQYADWLRVAAEGDQQAKAALDRLNLWSNEHCEKWYGPKNDRKSNFANVLAAVWRGDQTVEDDLIRLARSRKLSAMVRASLTSQMARFADAKSLAAAAKLLQDDDPQVRAAATASFEAAPVAQLIKYVTPLLKDPIRSVRTEAARVVARAPAGELTGSQRRAWESAFNELRAALLQNNDRAAAHTTLGIIYENHNETERAIQAYRTAIRVEPTVTGPRTNLAAVLERRWKAAESQAKQVAVQGNREEAMRILQRAFPDREESERLRYEELPWLARDARLAPGIAAVQYRYGLALYLQGDLEASQAALLAAARLAPQTPDFTLAVALLYQKMQRWPEALDYAERLLELRPDDRTYQQLLFEIRQQAAGQKTGPRNRP